MDLLEILKTYEREGRAMGHFNIANFDMLKAISNAAEKYNVPLFIGTSEGEEGYLGAYNIVSIIKSYNDFGYRLFLNADHIHSIEKLTEVVKAGYDSVIFDASKLDLEENIKKTKEAVLAAKEINGEVLIEGELGYVGASSKVLETIPEDVSLNPEDLPTAEEAKRFVEETGVDMLAPAVGNIHGMMKNAKNPDLNIERIKEIKEAVNVPLVLHGGSGLTDGNFKEAIKAGISLIHVSTEIRSAWRNSLEEALKNNPDEVAPYKIIPPVIKKMEEIVEGKIKLFYNL
jgi:fructose-bisphosphate aldolase, class II